MTSDDVLKATIETLAAAGLDVSITTEGGVAEVVVTDADTGGRYVVRDPDPWIALCQAVTAAGFDFTDG